MKQVLILSWLLLGLSMPGFAQPAEVLKSDAISAEGQENYELAAKIYEDAAKAFREQHVTDTVCIYRAGYNYYRVDAYEKAIPFLQECLALDYRVSRSCQLLSDAYLELKNIKKAEELLLEGKAKVPEDEPDFDKKLAYLYFNSGQYEKAAGQFGKLNSLSPGNRDYMYLYGFSLERLQRYDQAIGALESVLQQFPDDKKSKRILGLAYFERTDLLNNKEVKRYESMKNAKLEDYIVTTKNLDRINTGYEKARVILEGSLKDYPDDKLVISTLYKIYKKQNNQEKASRMNEKLIQMK